jgi:hypothetical protein
VLIRAAQSLPAGHSYEAVDEASAAALTANVIDEILALVPADWLTSETPGVDPAAVRAAYRRYLLERLAAPHVFAEEAFRAG